MAYKSANQKLAKPKGSSEGGLGGKVFDYENYAGENAKNLKPKSKYTPIGIDPAYPNFNFVKRSFDNKGDSTGYYDYMYGSVFGPEKPISKKASGYGHGVERRVGKLRMSGNKGAHRVGKR